MSEQIADGTVETPKVEDLQVALAKAEAKIVELKKAPIETPKEDVAEDATTETVEAATDENMETRIARAVAEAMIANNNVTSNNMSMSGTPAPADTFSLKTMSEYSALNATDQRKHMQECIKKTGEFSFKYNED
tara:strand:- start:298 stop:699 length:402 start_codon:yes stop_codon:yes gene_type:complete